MQLEPTFLVALVCALLVGAWLALSLRTWLERAAGRARHARGLRGERDAERLLRAQGYRIRERQARMRYAVVIDGKPVEIPLVLDFVVERDGEQLVAEVKTGASAPRITHPDTRRQLLEYQVATGSRRVLLVDPEQGTIRRVEFPVDASAHVKPSPWAAFALGALLCAALLGFWQLR
jgi:hypothetical protein